MEVKHYALLGIYERPSTRPTDGQTGQQVSITFEKRSRSLEFENVSMIQFLHDIGPL